MVYTAWKLFGGLVNDLLKTIPQSIADREHNLLNDAIVLEQPNFLRDNGYTLCKADGNNTKQVIIIILLISIKYSHQH